jgi:hypothetical protein
MDVAEGDAGIVDVFALAGGEVEIFEVYCVAATGEDTGAVTEADDFRGAVEAGVTIEDLGVVCLAAGFLLPLQLLESTT